MMEIGIELHSLLDSNIFSVTFDYDEWPGSHPNDETAIRAYNGSYFDIRLMYSEVFPEDEFKADCKTEDKTKIYKIKYTVNLLGQTGMFCQDSPDGDGELEIINEDVNLMSLCEETEEIELF